MRVDSELGKLEGQENKVYTRPQIIGKENLNRAGEMAQSLKALAALLEVLSSIPSNHVVAHNNL